MEKEIVDKVLALGGTFQKGKSLQENIEGINFDYPLYSEISWGEELYGVDEFYENNKALYGNNKKEFYNEIVAHFFSDHELPYGQTFYKKLLFTPFNEGTEDHEEWKEIFEDEEMTDLSEIKKVVGNGKLAFMEIASSYSFPDGYYICLSDPNPSNPTVFGTDHEVYFQEITNEGTLEDFFNQFYTQAAFLKVVKDYFENVKNK